MTELSRTEDIVRNVTLYRRKGDALARSGRDEDARASYDTALSLIDKALEGLSISPAESAAQPAALDVDVASDAADLLGVRGGILRRLRRPGESLESYRRGAEIEKSQDLPVTYNRANAIKLALIVGDRTVAQVRDELIALRSVLEWRLSTDERAADDAWIWADLGDVRLLLGDDDGAERAYRAFADKARTDSLTSALSVLRQVVDALDAHGDADAEQIAASLRKAERLLADSAGSGSWVRPS